MTPKTLTVVLIALLATACSSKIVSVAPSPVTPAPTAMTYAINIPDAVLAQKLKGDNPEGVQLPPVDAQARWDYTATYAGSPNVYFGDHAPWTGVDCSGHQIIGLQEYMGAGIVVAPRNVASVETFTAKDWPELPLTAGVTYAWLGRFEYAAPGRVLGGKCP